MFIEQEFKGKDCHQIRNDKSVLCRNSAKFNSAVPTGFEQQNDNTTISSNGNYSNCCRFQTCDVVQSGYYTADSSEESSVAIYQCRLQQPFRPTMPLRISNILGDVTSQIMVIFKILKSFIGRHISRSYSAIFQLFLNSTLSLYQDNSALNVIN